jgi:hypothetical protein
VDRYDFHADLRRALSGRKLRKTPKGTYEFRCLRHADSSASAWLGEYRWGCSACGFEEPLETLAGELGVSVPVKGFTLEDYAERKGFALDKLQKWGLRTETGKFGDDVVTIPFYDLDGKPLRSMIRTASKTFWGPGQGTYLYGLWMLKKLPKAPICLVEGQSDCHAGWHAKQLLIGVPGANAWKPEWSQYLHGREIYVWKEPDEGGAKFVAAILGSFPNAKVIVPQGVKDVADLYKAGPLEFSEKFGALMARALPGAFAPPKIHFDAVCGETLDRLLERKLKPVRAIPTPLPLWNQACRDEGGRIGLAAGWHVTAGAKTGAGKSLLALNLAATAVKRGHRVCFISLEMSDAQLMTRYLSILSGEPVYWLEQGAGFLQSAYKRAQGVADEIQRETNCALFVNSQPISDLADIREAIRYQVEIRGCTMVITDYLQLARVVGKSELLETVTEVSGVLRREAKELDIVSVGLSQFNRETSKDRDNPPTPQGLMGGSPLENDSDQVVLLDHTNYTRDDATQTARTILRLDKNRHGSCHEIPVEWDYSTLTLREVVKDLRGAYSPGDVPDAESSDTLHLVRA